MSVPCGDVVDVLIGAARGNCVEKMTGPFGLGAVGVAAGVNGCEAERLPAVDVVPFGPLPPTAALRVSRAIVSASRLPVCGKFEISWNWRIEARSDALMLPSIGPR